MCNDKPFQRSPKTCCKNSTYVIHLTVWRWWEINKRLRVCAKREKQCTLNMCTLIDIKNDQQVMIVVYIPQENKSQDESPHHPRSRGVVLLISPLIRQSIYRSLAHPFLETKTCWDEIKSSSQKTSER